MLKGGTRELFGRATATQSIAGHFMSLGAKGRETRLMNPIHGGLGGGDGSMSPPPQSMRSPLGSIAHKFRNITTRVSKNSGVGGGPGGNSPMGSSLSFFRKGSPSFFPSSGSEGESDGGGEKRQTRSVGHMNNLVSPGGGGGDDNKSPGANIVGGTVRIRSTVVRKKISGISGGISPKPETGGGGGGRMMSMSPRNARANSSQQKKTTKFKRSSDGVGGRSSGRGSSRTSRSPHIHAYVGERAIGTLSVK